MQYAQGRASTYISLIIHREGKRPLEGPKERDYDISMHFKEAQDMDGACASEWCAFRLHERH